MKALNNFLIGADPEFMLVENGMPVNVTRALGPPMLPEHGPVGWDHRGRVMELRPEPARHVYTVVRRIKKLLEESPMTRLKQYNWSILDPSSHDVTGGHIHFAMMPRDDGGWTWPGGVRSARHVAPALAMISYLLETLDILPLGASFKRRFNSEYGNFGDIRTKNNHFEYRAMSSWLHSPQAAFLALTAAKLTVCVPERALELDLGKGFSALQGFFRHFASVDVDAEKAVENILPEGVVALRTDPSSCFQERWERLGF